MNTVPLVWGFLHGEQKGLFDLRFRLPAECADLVVGGGADVGIIPSYELLGRDYAVVPEIGIACRGAVRSILLISKRRLDGVRRLAADTSSRTSVMLARIILARRYGTEPEVLRHQPDLPAMLKEADAALVIGDPALRLNPETLPFHVCDLGQEWYGMTGLPMVFAVWAGPRECITEAVGKAFRQSCAFGLHNLEQIVCREAMARKLPVDLVHRYLSSHIVFELGRAERQGMDLFLRYASALPALPNGLTPVASL